MKNFEPKQTNDSLSILVPKILRLLEKDEQWLFSNNRYIIIEKLLSLLNISIKVLLQTNLKTIDNKLFVEDALKKNFIANKEIYNKNMKVVYKKCWWQRLFSRKINEINQDLQLIDEKMLRNKTNSAFVLNNSKTMKLLDLNTQIRQWSIKTITIWNELFNKKKVLKQSEEMQEIYEYAIIPILNFLIQEDVIEYEYARNFEKIIKELVKYWISKTKNWKLLMNWQISICYWPLQEVTYHVKNTPTWKQLFLPTWRWDTSFWRKWTIWYAITEKIWNKKQIIYWGSEYFTLLQNWIWYLKSWKKWQAPKKVLLYILLKQEFLNYHLMILDYLKWLINQIQDNLKNTIKKDEKEKLIQIWNSVIVISKAIKNTQTWIEKNNNFM